ncbi:MAG TPA: hypothetical protein VK856_10550 [Anaerolineaceae bacterium]|nr:hypothetical protein [Anaerolineaceae bacterium]
MTYSFQEHLLFVAAAVLVLFLPGLVWILYSKNKDHDIVETMADAIGISVSLMAIVAMLFFYAGLSFSPLLIGIVFGGLVLAVLIKIFRMKFQISRQTLILFSATIIFLILLVVFRFYQAKDLVFPAWVDSVHHVLITQKILDNAGLPRTLAPELNIPFHYHYGFHLIAALFSWVSKLEPMNAVLWFGQVINALVVVGIYRLSKAVWQKTVPAFLAALLVGFAFQMPAYFVTWGRYTLLTGLLVLLPTIACSYEMVRRGYSRERAIRLLVLTAGLALVHYLALFDFGLFLLSLVIKRGYGWYRSKDKSRRKEILSAVLTVLISAGVGILIALPWLLRMLNAHAGQVGVEVVMPTKDNLGSYQYILYLLGPKHNYYLMGAALLGLIFVWWQKGARDIALWSTLMVLLSLPWGPRFGPFRPDHMAIVLFVPGSICLAYGWYEICEWIRNRFHRVVGWVIFASIALGVIGWGAWQTRSVINTVTILADQADKQALDWINQFVPEDARFLTNTTIWQYQTYRGVDGGYWIIPQTGRFALALPGLYGYGERDEVEEWINWMERAAVVHACDDGFWSLVKDANLSHVYLREGKGSLQPEALIDCPDLEIIYQQAGVSIYEIQATE